MITVRNEQMYFTPNPAILMGATTTKVYLNL